MICSVCEIEARQNMNLWINVSKTKVVVFNMGNDLNTCKAYISGNPPPQNLEQVEEILDFFGKWENF